MQAPDCKPRMRNPKHQEELNEVGVPWATSMSREVPGSPLELHTGQPQACCSKEQPPPHCFCRVTLLQGDAAQQVQVKASMLLAQGTSKSGTFTPHRSVQGN